MAQSHSVEIEYCLPIVRKRVSSEPKNSLIYSRFTVCLRISEDARNDLFRHIFSRLRLEKYDILGYILIGLVQSNVPSAVPQINYLFRHSCHGRHV